MFGGKKTRELEEELLAVKEQQNRLQQQISNIAQEKENTEETLVQVTISKSELDETISAMTEQLTQLKECSEANAGQTVLLKQQLAKKKEQNESLQQENEILREKLKKEQEAIAEVIKQNQGVTAPMQEIEAFYEAACQKQQIVGEALKKLADISQQMSVLALGAAIEAERMGEDGSKFMAAAEEVRMNAEQYTETVTEAFAQIDEVSETSGKAGEQIQGLQQLLHENNSSMTKLLESGSDAKTTGSGENVQDETDVEDILENLCQSENEFFEVQSKVLSMAETLTQEWKEHKECTDELERRVEDVHRFIQE